MKLKLSSLQIIPSTVNCWNWPKYSFESLSKYFTRLPENVWYCYREIFDIDGLKKGIKRLILMARLVSLCLSHWISKSLERNSKIKSLFEWAKIQLKNKSVNGPSSAAIWEISDNSKDFVDIIWWLMKVKLICTEESGGKPTCPASEQGIAYYNWAPRRNLDGDVSASRMKCSDSV